MYVFFVMGEGVGEGRGSGVNLIKDQGIRFKTNIRKDLKEPCRGSIGNSVQPKTAKYKITFESFTPVEGSFFKTLRDKAVKGRGKSTQSES